MLTINIHEAKTHLSRLVEQATKGEAFIIAKASKPLVKVVPLDEAESGVTRRLGFMEGDFDTLGDAEIVEMFEGKTP